MDAGETKTVSHEAGEPPAEVYARRLLQLKLLQATDQTRERRLGYAKLVIDELIPELKKSYKLSDNPDDHAIAGASSGAICAFTVAWQRPDQFRCSWSERAAGAAGLFERQRRL